MNDIELMLILAFAVGLTGAVVEGIVFRKRPILLSADLYRRFSQSPLNFWWRNYWLKRGPMQRREQHLLSFTVFFLVGMFTSVGYFALCLHG